MTFHIITLFPESLKPYLNASILGRAQKKKLVNFVFYNPRDFVRASKSQKKKKLPYLRVDDKPYGGGAGMVMQATPIVKAVVKALRKVSSALPPLIIWLTPSGRLFDNKMAEKFAKSGADTIIICGRYEGIDERAFKIIKSFKGSKIKKLSLGQFVLTGGEVPALAIIDAVSRRITGVLGKDQSVEERRVASSEVYTRPEVLKYRGKQYRVPKVLLSGNHSEIEGWRRKKSR
jgi:tRNA (guanine37-N1)-methyltransferase